MKHGICGLGGMGLSLGMQALEKGHEVVGSESGGSEEDKEISFPLLTQVVRGFCESRDPDRPWATTVALLRHQYGKHPLQGRAGSDS